MDCHTFTPSLKNNFSQETLVPRLVVMGAGGFVGRHVISLFKGRCEVLALTRREVDLLKPDSEDQLAALLKPEDVLLVTSAIAPCKNNEMLQDNIRMIDHVCRAIQKCKPAHVVYISSDAVYRDSKHRINENSCAQPDSLHGVMHLAREVMLKNSFSGPLGIVRPTLIYGKDDPHNGYGPNKFVRLMAQNEKVDLFGKGEELRDHIAVEDVAEITRRVIVHRSEGVVNAVSGKEISFMEIAQLVKKISGSSSVIQENPRKGPMPHNGFRVFDPKGYQTAFPGFECRSIEEGLKATL